jgi:hypothetical protein
MVFRDGVTHDGSHRGGPDAGYAATLIVAA